MMDIKKLSPWNWFRHEEEAERWVAPSSRHMPLPSLWSSSPLMPLHEEIERVFDQAFHNFGLPAASMSGAGLAAGAGKGAAGSALWKPSVDVESGDKSYRITAEVPGVDEKDIKVEISPRGTLVISGEKKQEREDKAQGVYRVERAYGAFQRTLSLPEDADRDSVSAAFKNGVLTITMGRRALPQSDIRQIEVNKGSGDTKPKKAA